MNTRVATPADSRARVHGIIVGAAVGDALGWPQEQNNQSAGGRAARQAEPKPEFRRWTRYSRLRNARYEETVGAGEYSDDTQLLLAIARSCQRSDWRTHFTTVELPAWLHYQRGGGRAVLAAARRWAAGHPPWLPDRSATGKHQLARYFHAGANGVAMRVAPHAIHTIAEPTHVLIARVITDGICTHGHPRALIGGVLHALALRQALLRDGTLAYGEPVAALLEDATWRDTKHLGAAVPPEWTEQYLRLFGHTPAEGWTEATAEAEALLNTAHQALTRGSLADDTQTLTALGCFDPDRNGAGHVSAVAAAYCAARAAAHPMSGLLLTAYLDSADTDTLASMTGSLLGAVHGTQWMRPLDDAVQDAGYIRTTADQLTDILGAGTEASNVQMSIDLLPVASRKPADRPIEKAPFGPSWRVGQSGLFPDGRSYTVTALEQLQASAGQCIRRWRLALEDRQTVLVDRAQRLPHDTGVHATQTPDPDRDRSGSSHAPAANAIRLTLGVRDLEKSLHFYRDILGLPAEHRTPSVVQVAPWLILIAIRQPRPETAEPAPIMLTIHVDDPSRVHQAANLHKYLSVKESAKRGQIRLRDPDGNIVDVHRDDSHST